MFLLSGFEALSISYVVVFQPPFSFLLFRVLVFIDLLF